MLFEKKDLIEVNAQIDLILNKIAQFETTYKEQINNVHPNYTKSAKNLIHYLAFRSFDIDVFQEKSQKIGLPNNTGLERSVLHNLLNLKTIINSLLNLKPLNSNNLFLLNNEAKELIKKNAEVLFGTKQNNRQTQIMVTQPTMAASDSNFTKSLLSLGMDCARINCAHDTKTEWTQIIKNIKTENKNCKIFMDLGGPKLRTGKMKPGHKVIHIKPTRNTLGQVTTPAKVWLAPYGILPPNNETADAVIPVNKKWLKKTRKGSYIIFKDSRNKKCRINIEKKETTGRWASCSDSAFVTTGTLLNVFIEKKGTSEIHSVHELLPLEEVIYLNEGDILQIDKEPILGEPAQFSKEGKLIKNAHISCTLPKIFNKVKVGEPIYFDDGKIKGVIEKITSTHLLVKITRTKKKGGKLKADKGINLPISSLGLSGLTQKDKTDLQFIAKNADAVNFSFVNNKTDIEQLLNEIALLKAKIGIVVKIETREAFKNLPSVLLKVMQNYPVGIMIARGDLAIETGWKNFVIIQEEILHVCEAAHIPDIWATQVLENLAKKGIPTRAEITDAAMAQRAECVMLNKGPYIENALKMLDKILCKMQRIQKKKTVLLPKLKFNNNL